MGILWVIQGIGYRGIAPKMENAMVQRKMKWTMGQRVIQRIKELSG